MVNFCYRFLENATGFWYGIYKGMYGWTYAQIARKKIDGVNTLRMPYIKTLV